MPDLFGLVALGCLLMALTLYTAWDASFQSRVVPSVVVRGNAFVDDEEGAWSPLAGQGAVADILLKMPFPLLFALSGVYVQSMTLIEGRSAERA